MPAARGKKLKIRESIKDNDAYFTAFINSIPSSVYFNDQAARKISRAQSQKAAEEGQLGPLASTGEVSQKWMNKRAKFNPNTVVTTSEMQALHARLPDDSGDKLELELLSGEQSEESELDGETSDGEVVIQDDTKGVKSRKRSAASEESEESGVVSSESADEKEKEASTKPPIKVAKKVKRMKDAQSLITNGHVEKHEPTLKPKARSEIPNQRLSTEQLREKLRARIESLQAKRFNDLSAEEYMEKKRLRRKESKLKLKERRREAKKLKVSAAKQRKQESAKLNGVAEIEPTKSTDNKNKMVFSKFEFSNERKEKKKEKLNKPKSYKELYEKVTAEKKQLSELKQTDAEKAQKLEEKAAWKKAMDLSRGVKVKDNPELIKKSMKREEKIKKKSQKKWQERTEQVAELKQKKQEKRTKNIQAKKQVRKDKKLTKAKKKGRVVSGF